MSNEILEIPKFEVRVRLRKYCTGCGLAFYVEMEHQPLSFKYTDDLASQIKYATHQLLKADCPDCHRQTKQISFYKDYDMKININKKGKK